MPLAIERLLQEKGIPYRLIRLNDKAFTVDDVVKYSEGDIKPEEICKTMILRGKKSDRKVAVLLRGRDRLNFSATKKQCGEEMTIANADQVRATAGVEPGAVCPFLLSVPLFVDDEVLRLTTLNCGSGDHLVGLEFNVQDLKKGTAFTSGAFAKSPTGAEHLAS